MRINAKHFVLVMAALLSLAFSGHAQSEEYKAIDPAELSFGLMGFTSEAETEEGETCILSGTFEKVPL